MKSPRDGDASVLAEQIKVSQAAAKGHYGSSRIHAYPGCVRRVGCDRGQRAFLGQ